MAAKVKMKNIVQADSKCLLPFPKSVHLFFNNRTQLNYTEKRNAAKYNQIT